MCRTFQCSTFQNLWYGSLLQFFFFLFFHLYTFTTNHTLTFVPEQISKRKGRIELSGVENQRFSPFFISFFTKKIWKIMVLQIPFLIIFEMLALHCIYLHYVYAYEYHRNGVEASFPHTFHKEQNEKEELKG